MQTQKRKVIPFEDAGKYEPAEFKNFDRRPVNYFRDMIVEDEPQAGPTMNEQELSERVEELLAQERKRLQSAHEQELRRQYEAGLSEGHKEAAGDLQRAIDLLKQYAEVLQAEKQEIAGRAEQHSVELSFLLAKIVIGQELEQNPDLIAGMAKMAIQQVLDCDHVELKVNPDDLGYLKTVQQDLEAVLSGQSRLELRVDKTLPRGSCMIETERGMLDARVSSQLETLREHLRPAGAARE